MNSILLSFFLIMINIFSHVLFLEVFLLQILFLQTFPIFYQGFLNFFHHSTTSFTPLLYKPLRKPFKYLLSQYLDLLVLNGQNFLFFLKIFPHRHHLHGLIFWLLLWKEVLAEGWALFKCFCALFEFYLEIVQFLLENSILFLKLSVFCC